MKMQERYKELYHEMKCDCGKVFYTPKKTRKGKRGMSGLRQKGSKTCSRECSIKRRDKEAL